MPTIGKFLQGRLVSLSSEERRALTDAIGVQRDVAPRTSMVRQGDRLVTSTLLLDGFIGRYLDGRQGSRQLIALHVPGDFVDLHGFPLGYLDHDVGSLTAATTSVFGHRELRLALEAVPTLWPKLWYSTMLDAAMHRQWVFRLGRLDAVARLANFMCELAARLAAVDLSDGNRFALPLTQVDIAEMCGLTHIHVNRVLRQLREEGLLEFRSGQVVLCEPAALARRGQFDPNYLYLDPAVAVPGGGDPQGAQG